MNSPTAHELPSPANRAVSLAHRQRLLGAFVFVAGAFLICNDIAFLSAWPCDDAFIFMRIARSFVDFGKPYFNPGQAVMGHSSHLWIWLLAAFFRVLGPGVGTTEILAMLSSVACFGLLTALLLRAWPGRHVLTPIVSLGIFLLVVAPAAGSLMETPLALAALLAALLAIDLEKDGWAGFLCGLAFLSRYEFALIVLLGLAAVRRRRAFLLGLAPTVVAFLAFTLGYYRTVIPETVLAKAKVYQGDRSALLGMIHWPLVPASSVLHVLALLVLCACVAVAGWTCVRRWRRQEGPARRWPSVALMFGVTLFLLHVIQNGIMFPWYWPLVLFPSVVGLCGLASESWLLRAAPLLFLLSFGQQVSAYADTFRAFLVQSPEIAPRFVEDLRVRQYEAIGQHLKAALPNATLLTSEIGGLGWGFYPNRLIDGAALVSPENLKFHPMRVPEDRNSGSWGCIPPGAVEASKPDFVVSMPLFSQAFRRALHHHELPYKLVERWPVTPPDDRQRYHLPGSLWGNHSIAVYQRLPDTDPPRLTPP